ncbi:MAG TPA: MBL fold metallo-hydrolase [Chitinophagales bacterium]|nr:MBL fold metallo-hydrolase [Chitinophagales bacterium]
MKVIFLGTGTSTGVPVIACKCAVCHSIDQRDHRLRSSVYIETDQTKIVIDTGPDFRIQMLSQRLTDIDAVVFTHNHKDHTGGLDDIRPINFINKKVIDVYAEEYVQNTLRMEYPYIFVDQDYPGVPQIKLHKIDDTPFRVGDLDIIPIRVMHKNLPVLGYRIGDFTYITDANYIAPEELKKIKGSKYLVLNALRKETHYSHFSLSEALEIVDIIQPEQAFLTHISHNMGFYDEVQRSLPENVLLAYDGLSLNV